MIPIPDFARRMAQSAGCPDDEIDELWERHCELCDADRSDYGGGRWKGLVDAHLKRPRAPTISRDDPIARAARRAEREAKRLVEIEYLKTAVSLEDWIADLRVRDDFFEPLTPAERALTTFRDRYANEEPWQWLMAALDTLAPQDARRAHPCGTEKCPRPAMQWVARGRVYHGGRCAECQAAEDAAGKGAA